MYAVAYTDLFDYITVIEFVDAESPEDAILKIERLADYFQNILTSELEIGEMLKILFDGDMIVGVEEVPS